MVQAKPTVAKTIRRGRGKATDAAALAEYEAGNLDMIDSFPAADQDRILADPVLSQEYSVGPTLCTYYYGYNTKAPVVDDVRVRRALSMAIDRQALVDNVTKGGQEPAQWFARPGLNAAPTMADYPDLGIQSDPEAAKATIFGEANRKADAGEFGGGPAAESCTKTAAPEFYDDPESAQVIWDATGVLLTPPDGFDRTRLGEHNRPGFVNYIDFVSQGTVEEGALPGPVDLDKFLNSSLLDDINKFDRAAVEAEAAAWKAP